MTKRRKKVFVSDRCTEMQYRFAERYVVHGEAQRAAEEAGAKGTPGSISVTASRWLSLAKVQREIGKIRATAAKSGIAEHEEACTTATRIMRDPNLTPAERLNGLNALAKLRGMYAAERHRHEHNIRTPRTVRFVYVAGEVERELPGGPPGPPVQGELELGMGMVRSDE